MSLFQSKITNSNNKDMAVLIRLLYLVFFVLVSSYTSNLSADPVSIGSISIGSISIGSVSIGSVSVGSVSADSISAGSGDVYYVTEETFGYSMEREKDKHRAITFIPKTSLLFNIDRNILDIIDGKDYLAATTQDGVTLYILEEKVSTETFIDIYGTQDVIFNKSYRVCDEFNKIPCDRNDDKQVLKIGVGDVFKKEKKVANDEVVVYKLTGNLGDNANINKVTGYIIKDELDDLTRQAIVTDANLLHPRYDYTRTGDDVIITSCGRTVTNSESQGTRSENENGNENQEIVHRIYDVVDQRMGNARTTYAAKIIYGCDEQDRSQKSHIESVSILNRSTDTQHTLMPARQGPIKFTGAPHLYSIQNSSQYFSLMKKLSDEFQSRSDEFQSRSDEFQSRSDEFQSRSLAGYFLAEFNRSCRDDYENGLQCSAYVTDTRAYGLSQKLEGGYHSVIAFMPRGLLLYYIDRTEIYMIDEERYLASTTQDGVQLLILEKNVSSLSKDSKDQIAKTYGDQDTIFHRYKKICYELSCNQDDDRSVFEVIPGDFFKKEKQFISDGTIIYEITGGLGGRNDIHEVTGRIRKGELDKLNKEAIVTYANLPHPQYDYNSKETISGINTSCGQIIRDGDTSIIRSPISKEEEILIDVLKIGSIVNERQRLNFEKEYGNQDQEIVYKIYSVVDRWAEPNAKTTYYAAEIIYNCDQELGREKKYIELVKIDEIGTNKIGTNKIETNKIGTSKKYRLMPYGTPSDLIGYIGEPYLYSVNNPDQYFSLMKKLSDQFESRALVSYFLTEFNRSCKSKFRNTKKKCQYSADEIKNYSN